jgi:hypothetical protein
MKIIANNRRMYIGGWLAAAAVLLGANLSKLGQLEFQPLAESPAIVNQLRLRLLQFDEFMSARRAESEAALEPPIVLTRLQPKPSLPSSALAVSANESTLSPRSLPLPNLTGILQVERDTGGGRYCAVLDGKVYSEKDSIADLRIEEISGKGVVLGRRDQRWFIPVPEVYYSIGQKDHNQNQKP